MIYRTPPAKLRSRLAELERAAAALAPFSGRYRSRLSPADLATVQAILDTSPSILPQHILQATPGGKSAFDLSNLRDEISRHHTLVSIVDAIDGTPELAAAESAMATLRAALSNLRQCATARGLDITDLHRVLNLPTS
jgi:hypothetical protein